jgi:hypothetical protein
MLIYSPIQTNRFQFAVELLWNALSVENGKLTQNIDEFKNYKGAKINYSTQQICIDELWIEPNGLLSELGIKQQTIDVFEWNNLKVFFKTNGTIPFDFFAASFYLVTRYEEYLPHEKDMYGRYAHINSLAFKHNFLQQPLVNLWALELVKYIPNYQQTNSKLQTPNFIPTYDIDIAFTYLYHNPFINVAGFFRDFIKGKFELVSEKLLMFAGNKKDPFDVYDWLNQLHKKYQLKPIYFFLLAQKRKGYDKNISPNSPAMQQLIQQHVKQYATGIHPSWQSGDDETILQREINALQIITQQPVELSRQHYIRMTLPETYKLLLQKGIRHDYSMGYGSINGFRASYTLPFNWYDLSKEEQTNLMIHPFCYMEANSFFEQKLRVDEAANELQQYYDLVKNVNGQLITIFHNHFLTEQSEWVAWRNMYEQFLDKNFR